MSELPYRPHAETIEHCDADQDPDAPKPFEPHIVARSMADIEPEELKWLRPGVFPLGKLSLLVGVPGLGKSFLTLDMAARVSTGTPWPESQDTPNPVGHVLLLNGEDGLADTIRPRLDAAGANVANITAIEGVQREALEAYGIFKLDRDMRPLEALIEANRPRLVVIDPLSCFLGKVDSHRDAELRGVLAPLADLADRYRCAVVVVSHLNKKQGGMAIERVQGSIGFVGAARAAWLVAKSKSDPEVRWFLTIKMNVAKEARGFAFSIAEGRVEWLDDRVDVYADDALAVQDTERDTEIERARVWLGEQLAIGPAWATEITEQAKHGEDISASTLKRAKKLLNVKSDHVLDGDTYRWQWRLPDRPKESIEPF